MELKALIEIKINDNKKWDCKKCKIDDYNGCNSFLKIIELKPCPGIVTKINIRR